jgi:hypothetical protein
MKEETISKTARFYKKDIIRMIEIEQSPKQIFRLGIKAYDQNPQIIARVNEYETQVKKLSNLLQQSQKRIYELEKERDL